MKTWAWVLGIIVVAVLIYIAYFFGYQQGKLTSDATKTSSPTASATIVTSPTATVVTTNTSASTGGYGNWQAYTDKNIGYTIKYPTGWTVKEINQYNQTIGNTVKYITITTPDGKNFLQFGVKKPTDTFAISDRTGIGAGDIIQDTDNPVSIFGVNLIADKLEYGGKAKEYYYKEPTDGKTICKCEFSATFSYTDKADYNTMDLEQTEYAATVQKILASAAWL